MRQLILCAWLAGLLGGCASTHPATVKDKDQPYQEKSRVQWNSTNLKALLSIENAVAEREPSGLLLVRLAIRNKTRDDIWVDIRTTFTNPQGFEEEQTNWEPIGCTARTVTTYTVRSLGSQVADYMVLIRDPRESTFLP